MRRKCVLGITTVVLGTGAALILGELLLRSIGYEPRLSDRTMYVQNANREYPYKLAPNYDDFYLGKHVTIDGQGRRRVVGAEQVERGRAQTLVLLGDSLVFGHGVSDEDTLGSQLQRLLLARGLGWRVENIAAAGYTSWNEYHAMREYLDEEDANIVVVVYVPNDISFDNDQLGIGKGQYTVQSDGGFHRLTQWIYQRFYLAFLLRDSIARFSRDRTSKVSVADVYLSDDKALAYSMEAISKIRRLSARRKIQLFVAVYRDVWHYSDPERSGKYETRVIAALKSRGITTFLLNAHVARLPLQEARAAWNDPHPSEKALGLLAAQILDNTVAAR